MSRQSVADQPAHSRPGGWPVCSRCLSASTGTRSVDATSSPAAAASAFTPPNHISVPNRASPPPASADAAAGGDAPAAASARSIGPCAASNVLKKSAEHGAEPIRQTPIPRYRLAKPPPRKPAGLCSRVLSVSIGKSAPSTASPASAPATIESVKRLPSKRPGASSVRSSPERDEYRLTVFRRRFDSSVAIGSSSYQSSS